MREAELAELVGTTFGATLAEPQAGERVRPRLRIGKDLLEMARHLLAMCVEGGLECVPVGETHAHATLARPSHPAAACASGRRWRTAGGVPGDAGNRRRRTVRRALPAAAACAGRQQVEDLQRCPDLQRGVAAATDQLEDLGDELDLADAARTELDVVGHVLARHLSADLRMQVAHRVDGAEIEVLCGRRRAGDLLHQADPLGLQVVALVHDARLDPRVAFPFAAPA